MTYDFHCKYIKRNYDEYVKLLFTDTDRLVHKVEKMVYKDFYEHKALFDFSDYPEDSKFSDLVNKKVLGKMKDEFKGKIISEFVGLKSNVYYLIDVKNEENLNKKNKK